MNLIFLVRQETLVDLIMNYVAFIGISEMDNLYLRSVQKMKAKNMIEDEDKKK
jgi:hypothetical protein